MSKIQGLFKHFSSLSNSFQGVKVNEKYWSKNLFVAFLGINKFRRVGLIFMCWFYNENTYRLTESGFMEKPGIKPGTPGLQGIGLSPTPRRLI